MESAVYSIWIFVYTLLRIVRRINSSLGNIFSPVSLSLPFYIAPLSMLLTVESSYIKAAKVCAGHCSLRRCGINFKAFKNTAWPLTGLTIGTLALINNSPK